MQLLIKNAVRYTSTVVSLAALAACGSMGSSHSAAAPERVAAAPAVAEAPQDDAITQNVKAQLAREIPLAEIDVRTSQGKVQLKGVVEDSDAARRAVKGALAVDGVRGVVNDLNVSPEGAGRGTELAASASSL